MRLISRLLFGCVSVLTAITYATAAENDTVLRNSRLTLTLSQKANGAILSLMDNATGAEFVAPQAAPRLFNLAFSKKSEPTGDRFYLSSRDAQSYSVRSKSDGATLTYDKFANWPLRVVCTATVSKKDSLVRWRLTASIPEELVLEEVQFPFVVLRAPLGNDVADDAAVFGHTKGGVIRRPGAMKPGWRVYGRQPGSLAAQFGCYYDNSCGVYLAAYDSKGYPKDFEMRRTAEGIEMDWNPHCYVSKSYTTDFDVVMTTFAGSGDSPTDWRDAADIYKSWALTQPWCATLFQRRKDIPTWMKEGPAMVRFGREWLTNPERIESWLKDYWKKYFPNAPLITAYW